MSVLYVCFIYGVIWFDLIQNQGLRLSPRAFRTLPTASLCVGANESPLYLRRQKLALQFVTKIVANTKSPDYETI